MYILKLFLKVTIYLAVMPVCSQTSLEQSMTIVIDPGHGGSDTGAIGVNGVQEKEVVLQVAKQMIHWNRVLFDDKYNIYLTRYTDTLISLRDRTRLAKALKVDVFISLHCNQSKDPKAKGTEVYVANSNGKHLKFSIILGYQIAKAMQEKLGFRNRGVKLGDFQVLRETVDYCPAVLVELGFLSQTDEAIYLTKEESQYATAFVLFQSITKYLGLW